MNINELDITGTGVFYINYEECKFGLESRHIEDFLLFYINYEECKFPSIRGKS